MTFLELPRTLYSVYINTYEMLGNYRFILGKKGKFLNESIILKPLRWDASALPNEERFFLL